MAWYRCSGGSGGNAEPIQLYDYDMEKTGTQRTSWTTKTFSVKAGDIVLCAIMNRSNNNVTFPDGFTVVDSVYYGGQGLIVAYKKVASDASESYTVSQTSNARFAATFFILRGVKIFAGDKQSSSGTMLTFSNIKKLPYIVFTNNVYSGSAWYAFYDNEYAEYLASGSSWGANAFLAFGTAYHTSMNFYNGGQNVSGILIYLAEEH